MIRAGQQFARLQTALEVGEGDDAIGRGAAHEVFRAQLARMLEPCRRDKFRQRLDGLTMEVGDAVGLIAHHDGALA
jgi:hypothetical protein